MRTSNWLKGSKLRSALRRFQRMGSPHFPNSLHISTVFTSLLASLLRFLFLFENPYGEVLTSKLPLSKVKNIEVTTWFP